MEFLPILGQHKTISENMWVSSNRFQYAGVSLTELINENAFSLARNLSIVPLKLFVNVPDVIISGLILCMVKFIDKRKWYC